MPENLKQFIENTAPYAILGGIGGIIAQLNGYRKGNKLTIAMLLCNIISGSYVGGVIGPNLPADLTIDIRFAITSVSGVLSFAILDLLQKRGIDLILKKLGLGQKN